MAGKRVLSKLHSPGRSRGIGGGAGPGPGAGLQKRQARVTVKYDRRELQRRLDVEKWIDGRLEELYRGWEGDMPEEVNIDELLEMENEEERGRKIQVKAAVQKDSWAELRGLQRMGEEG
uniref:Protein phosphatase 1 regulatory subunit 14 n=1 Tax=Ornithorhynchus anatinus TaxID=9258 RepID=A0A6I8N452_ORNAN